MSVATAVWVALVLAGLAVAVFFFMRKLRSSSAKIILDSPASIGSPLRGTIYTGLRDIPSEVKLTLRCVHQEEFSSVRVRLDETFDGDLRFSVGAAQGPDVRTPLYDTKDNDTLTTIFEETQVLQRKSIGGSPSGFTIPIRFELPHDAHVTVEEGKHTYSWYIDAFADVPGIDFHATFPISVGARRGR